MCRSATTGCIRASLGQPTIRFKNTSFTTQRYSVLAPVQWSVVSDSHSSVGAAAAHSRLTRSSCRDGMGRLLFPQASSRRGTVCRAGGRASVLRQRHRDWGLISGELANERVEPFPADEPARDRRPRDGTLQLLTRGAFPTAGLPKFVVLCAFLAEPGIERPDTDAEAVRDLSDCRLRASTQRDPDDVVQTSKPDLA